MPEHDNDCNRLADATNSAGSSLVITTIRRPTAAVKAFALSGIDLILIGDEKTPSIEMDGCRYYDVENQLETGLRTAATMPLGHYCRKNVGYLIAIERGAAVVLESDDDNLPGEAFFEPRCRDIECSCVTDAGWTNVYQYFTDVPVWPRGLPLNFVRNPAPPIGKAPRLKIQAPIQQGLVDCEPDVDAVYRMTQGKLNNFHTGVPVGLGRGSWCPFNSQNTAWWPEAFCLMYLPCYCSFRMTDIWRSFVAQRIAWENDWCVLFHGPTVRQIRNEHDLMRDFVDEIPGYVHNQSICDRLAGLALTRGVSQIPDNMRICYDAMIKLGVLPPQEMRTLDAWLDDFQLCISNRPQA